MKFKNINLQSFGKFENRNFSFSDRLNVIYGRNEAGKSTLSASLRYILYGFSAWKTRNVETNDKLKYTSWTNGTMAASAELSCGDKNYRIERFSAAKSTIKITDEFGRECNFGKEPGEVFLGVDENAFVKMSCIRQNEVAEASDGLSDLVQNIVYSADESVDITKAEKKLTEYRNFFRSPHRKTGKCYELEDKIASLRFAFGEASEAHKTLLGAEARLIETRKRIELNEQKIKELEKELLNIDGYEAARIIEKVVEAKQNLDAAKEEYESAKAAVSTEKGICDGKILADIASAYEAAKRCENEMLSAKESLEQLRNSGRAAADDFGDIDEEDIDEAKEKYLASARNTKIFSVLAAIFAGLGVVFALIGFKNALFLIGAAALMGVAIIAFVVGSVGFLKAKAALKECGFEDFEALVLYESRYGAAKESFFEESARERILSDTYGEKKKQYEEEKEKLHSKMALIGAENVDPEKLVTLLKDAVLRYEKAKTTLEKIESVYDAFLSTNDIHALKEAAEHFVSTPEREKKTVSRELEFIKKATEQLLEKEKELIKQASYNASAIRKPAEILAEREATEEQLIKAVECADAADLALAALKSACEDLKNGISPEIARRASRLFNMFTDGKYEGLSVSGEFGLGIVENGMLKEAAYLSRGTKDVAYLSLRVALCEVLFKEKPVIILDEIFAYIDDVRFSAILNVLEKLSEEYQVFVFTCHEREKAALEKLSGANVIEI